MSQKQNLKTAIEQAAKELNVEVPQFTDKTTVKDLETILESLESKLSDKTADNTETDGLLDAQNEGSDNTETDDLLDESESQLDELAPSSENEQSVFLRALLTFEYTNFDGASERLVKGETDDIPIKEAEAAIRAGVAVEV